MMLATTIYFQLDSYTRVYNHLLKMKFKIQSILGRNYFSGPKFDKSIIAPFLALVTKMVTKVDHGN